MKKRNGKSELIFRFLIHTVLMLVILLDLFGDFRAVSAHAVTLPTGEYISEHGLVNKTPKKDTWKPDTQSSVDLTYSINLPALQAGQSTRVEIWLSNTGLEALYQMQFKVTLPAGLNYVPGSTRWRKRDYHGGAWFGPSPVYDPNPGFSPMQWSPIEISGLSDLQPRYQPESEIQISFEVEPNCLFSGGDLELYTQAEEFSGTVYTFTDSVSTTYSEPDLDVSITSNKSSTNPIGVFDTVTWNIRVANESGYDLDVVWVEADLGTAFSYNSSTGDATYGIDNGTNSGQTVTWELSNLSAGATANLTLRAISDSAPCSTDLDVDVDTTWGIGLVDGSSATKPGVNVPDNNACLFATPIHSTHSGTREPNMVFISSTLSPSTISGFGGLSTLLVGVENKGTTDAYDTDLVITLPTGLAYDIGSSENGFGTDSSVVISASGDPQINSNRLTYYDPNDSNVDLFNQIQAAGGNDTGMVALSMNACGASPSNEIAIEYTYYSVCWDTRYTISTTSNLAVNTPELEVTHQLPAYMAPNSSARVQITLTNTGSASPGNNNHMTIVEKLPPGLSYEYTQTMWRVAGGAWQDSSFYSPHITGNELTWYETDLLFSPDSLAPNTSLELSFVVVSDNSFSGGDFENSTSLELICSTGNATFNAQNTDTLALLPPGPVVTTNSASSITAVSATLNGEVDAIGYETDITFEYGLTNAYGTSVFADQSPLDTATNTPVTTALSNLLPNTEYHYRVVAENSIGTTNGTDQTFTTLGLSITTEIHSGSVHSAVTSANIGDSLHAMATVVGNGPQPTGLVHFTVYDNPACFGTGTMAGNIPLDASGVADPSASALLTTNGLSFKANYQGDSNYAAADGLCTPISTSAFPDILPLSIKAIPQDNAIVTTGLSNLTVQFNQDVLHGAASDPDSADNPLNYLLVEAGVNGTFETIACGGTGGGLQADDMQITINSAVYDSAQFTTELMINDGDILPDGKYYLFICGTTSIANPDRTVYLNNHLSDSAIRFSVQAQNNPTSNVTVLPATGFPPNKGTVLSDQPSGKMYSQTGMEIQIPAIDVRKPVVGVDGPEWDISWLGDDIGYLQGTAFPTWNGNSVLTGHVVNANGHPGPFAKLSELKWGDQLIIHAWGQQYVYEVRSIDLWVSSNATAVLNQHEEFPWVTLITCHGYNEKTDSYRWRTIVRAVLVEVRDLTNQ